MDTENATVLLRVAQGRKKSEITLTRESAIVLRANLRLAIEMLDEDD